jgi:hypothetical protein
MNRAQCRSMMRSRFNLKRSDAQEAALRRGEIGHAVTHFGVWPNPADPLIGSRCTCARTTIAAFVPLGVRWVGGEIGITQVPPGPEIAQHLGDLALGGIGPGALEPPGADWRHAAAGDLGVRPRSSLGRAGGPSTCPLDRGWQRRRFRLVPRVKIRLTG